METHELREISTCDPLWEYHITCRLTCLFLHITSASTLLLLEQNAVAWGTLPNYPHPDLRAAAPQAPAIFTPMRCSRHIPLTRQTSSHSASWLFSTIKSIVKFHLAWWGTAPASRCARNFHSGQHQQNLTCRCGQQRQTLAHDHR